MQKQTIDENKEATSGFEQCPVCESYQITEEVNQFCCKRCGVVWVAVRRFEE